ncbi:ATP synthase mitochondrial F1 complex assembly factor 1-like isoform X2 [Dysidea avara]
MEHHTRDDVKPAKKEDHVIPKEEVTSQPKYSFAKPPQLDKVMRVELLVDKNDDEIAQIWKTYHSDKDSVCAVMPAKLYDEMMSRAKDNPMFLHPVPKSGGYEMILSQFDNHGNCYFTSLLNYKTHQDAAPIWLTLTHYSELLDSKGIVLMAGEVDTAHLSIMEAQYLANQIQLYYTSGDKERHHLLTQFNHHPNEFDYTKLIELLTQKGINS